MKNIGLFIGEAARQYGITVKQLRTWTDHGLVGSPQYVACGQRRYRIYHDNHMERIKLITQFLDEGYTLKAAAEKAAEAMEEKPI